jgi:hypothetical protein
MAACALWPLPARAQFMTNADLSQSCALGSTPERINRCLGYIAGVIDYHVVMQSLGTNPSTNFCLPPDVLLEQAAIEVLAYLAQKPEQGAFIAAPAVALALNRVYPCASVR